MFIKTMVSFVLFFKFYIFAVPLNLVCSIIHINRKINTSNNGKFVTTPSVLMGMLSQNTKYALY